MMTFLFLLSLFLLVVGVLLTIGWSMSPAPSQEATSGPVLALIGFVLLLLTLAAQLMRWLM